MKSRVPWNFIFRSLTHTYEECPCRFVLSVRRIFQPGSETQKRNHVLNSVQNSTEENIDAFNQSQHLLKRCSYAVKHNVFPLWNLPDVEEMPSHDGETV
ncbi:hypothetical protein TNCV_1697071 [Trichonephila clavipes]|nr:hypothetical protein TNCV_1697071 [Trichonephila clavipes]